MIKNILFFVLILTFTGPFTTLIGYSRNNVPFLKSDVKASYYIAPNGSDTNPGTYEKPFQTLQKARDIVRTVNKGMSKDIIVVIRGGWYSLSSSLTLDARDSGSNGHYVIYKAYPGEYPVISGGKVITGWTQHDKVRNIWKAPAAGLNTRQLYVNCARGVRAHSDGGFLKGMVIKTPTGYTTIDPSPQQWRNPGNIEFVYNGYRIYRGSQAKPWREYRIGVASISGTSSKTTIEMKQSGWNRCINEVTQPTDIENIYEFLDEPGEWYLDRTEGTIYVIPRSGEDMIKANVVAPVLEQLIVGAGTLDAPLHHVQFKGLTFAHATWLSPSGENGYKEIQSCFESNNSRTPGNISFMSANHVKIDRCVFKHLGAVGLDIFGGCQNFEVNGCLFTEVSANCIQIGTVDDPARLDRRARETSITIRNCYIHDSPCEYRGGCGIMVGYVSDLFLTHNEIGYTPFGGISVGWGWGKQESFSHNIHVTYNNIHHWAQTLMGTGAIYSIGPQPGSSWNNNWTHDTQPWNNDAHDGSGLRGFYPDEASAYIDIHDNVMSEIGNKLWFMAWTKTVHDIKVYNNFTSSPNLLNNGTNVTIYDNTEVLDGNWPPAARRIMNNAGLEPDYREVKTMKCGCSVAQGRLIQGAPDL